MGAQLIRPLVFASLAVAAPMADQAGWHLPATIETLRNVAARPGEAPAQARGVLYVSGRKAFTIPKGRRFLMIAIAAEGECRIEFDKHQYDVSSCPWLDGFADHQPDFFKVVSGRAADAAKDVR
jgi:hypothetical protein